MMKSRGHFSLLLLFALSLVAPANAQTRPIEAPAGNGSISGRVTAEGKPLAGLHLVIQLPVSGGQAVPPVIRADTDMEGRYQFTGLVAGSYQLRILSPIYAAPRDIRSAPGDMTISVGEAETVSNVDLALVRGGVVTGKVVDPEGHPLIESFVQFDRLDEQGRTVPFFGNRSIETDDRGIYRAFGIQPGRYRVSVGEGEGSIRRMSFRKSFPRTFHPDTLETAKASIVEVGEATETTGIDIRMHQAVKTFAITGRAIDAQSNQPVGNANISVSLTDSAGRSMGFTSSVMTGADGQFRMEALRPGGYMVFAGRLGFSPFDTPNQGYSDPINVELNDSDATGIEVRVKRGGSISGIATIEGTSDPAILVRLSQQRVAVQQMRVSVPQSSQTVMIAPDGKFLVEGLRPGRVVLSSIPTAQGSSMGLTLSRIERAGVQSMSFELGDGENVSDLKLVFVHGSGVVRGQVVVKGEGLPKDAFFFVNARRRESQQASRSARTDVRGVFVIEDLPPGEYEILATPNLVTANSDLRRRAIARQTVAVSNGQTVQLALVIDLTNKEGGQ